MSNNQNRGEKENSLVPKLPKLPNVELPPSSLPNVRPQVKQGVDRLIPSLTNDELHYVVQLVSSVVQQRLAQRKPSEPVDPVLQDVLDDIKLAEMYVTQGYTVEYPPKRLVPVEESEGGAGDILELIFERLDPLFKSDKVQDGLARLLNALAEKLEGKK
jgi:hypothetical protein